MFVNKPKTNYNVFKQFARISNNFEMSNIFDTMSGFVDIMTKVLTTCQKHYAFSNIMSKTWKEYVTKCQIQLDNRTTLFWKKATPCRPPTSKGNGRWIFEN